MNYALNLASNGIKTGVFLFKSQFVYAVAPTLSSITFKAKSTSGSGLPVFVQRPWAPGCSSPDLFVFIQ